MPNFRITWGIPESDDDHYEKEIEAESLKEAEHIARAEASKLVYFTVDELDELEQREIDKITYQVTECFLRLPLEQQKRLAKGLTSYVEGLSD